MMNNINCCSILAKSKIESIEYVLSNHPFQIVALTETWIKNGQECLADFSNLGYTAVYQNRTSGKKGVGIGFLCKSDVTFKHRIDINSLWENTKLFQAMFLEVGLHNTNRSFIVGVIYKPPNENHDTFMTNLTKSLGIIRCENKQCFQTGDFNINLLDQTSNCADALLNSMFPSGFFPLIDKPTRITRSSKILIDLMFTNFVNDDLTSGILTDISDHLPIFTYMQIDSKMAHSNRPTDEYYRDFSNRNWEKLEKMLQKTDWLQVIGPWTNDTTTQYNNFMTTLDASYKEAFPLIQKSTVVSHIKENLGLRQVY